jgi:hypothetical protein
MPSGSSKRTDTGATAVAASLGRFDPVALEAHAGAIYALTADLRLAYFNRAWFRFAAENDGEPAISRDWPIGRSLLDCLPAGLDVAYVDGYRRCMRDHVPWVHEYDCSSPTRARRFHQIAYPLDADAGVLIVNSPLVARATGDAAAAPDYADAGGLLHQCMHCRRFLHTDEPDRWDFLPAWATAFPRNTSHGLCSTCFSFYYPAAATRA